MYQVVEGSLEILFQNSPSDKKQIVESRKQNPLTP